MSYKTVTLKLVDSVVDMCERDISIRSIAKSLPISRGTISSIIKDPQKYRNRIRSYDRSRIRNLEYIDGSVAPYFCVVCHNTVVYKPCKICKARKLRGDE